MSVVEKPPEQIYRTIKCPLKSVLKNYDHIQPIIESTIKDINPLVIYCYQFTRLYLINKFNNKEKLPTINKQFILDIIKTIGKTETTAGKKTLDKNIKNKNEKSNIKIFYNNTFSKIVKDKPSYTNKTFILEQTANEIITCIETNISIHFVNYLFKYINCLFKEPKSKIIKDEKDKTKRDVLYKELNKEIRDLKSDLINNKIELSDKKYHKWIKDNKKFLYPLKITKSVAYDIKIHPTKYLSYAFYINKKIEELGKRPYQVIPQRNNITPKHITLNTCAFVDIIDDKKKDVFDYNKTELILHGKKHQKHIWSKILKLEKRSIFEQNNYIFYNQMSTDGFSCSLLFILKKYKDKKFGDKLPKFEDDNEFNKLDDLTKGECKKYSTNKYKLLFLDPGKIRPISVIDENDKFYKYSACRRRNDTYTKRSNQIIDLEKKKNKIDKKENILSKFSCRTLDETKYKDFIKEKNKVNEKTKDFYDQPLLRKLKFRRFTKTKQSNEQIIKEIRDTFLTKKEQKNNKKIVICHGDYSRTTQMKGTISTPNIGMKKLLEKQFEILDVNEFNTSKLYNKTLTELTNVKVRRGNHNKMLHEILTPKEETNNCIFVNRDVNACKNIRYITKYYLKYQKRPKEFQRKKQNVI